jgi:nucleoside-diphosphate kinase
MERMTRIVMVIAAVLVVLIIGYVGYKWYSRRVYRSNKIEQTLAIIKPNAVLALNTGKIIDRIEQAGFTIVDMRKVTLGREQVERFYQEHQGKKFFNDLIEFMISGPIVVLILEKLNAIPDWRDFMGATDPVKAKEGTIRKQFAISATKNAVHGSDSHEAAAREIKFFFTDRMK